MDGGDVSLKLGVSSGLQGDVTDSVFERCSLGDDGSSSKSIKVPIAGRLGLGSLVDLVRCLGGRGGGRSLFVSRLFNEKVPALLCLPRKEDEVIGSLDTALIEESKKP